MRTRFNPCGQIWTWLTACGPFTLRIFVGGVETFVPARWYWAPPGASVFPSPHGAESARWLANDEVNWDWGEVTRWPKDPSAEAYSVTAAGTNPGYTGQGFCGDPQWFVDGRLPANILQGTPPPFCPGCATFTPPQAGAGGLVLGGSALASRPALEGQGGLILGGAAVAGGPTQPYVARGGLVQGGAAVVQSGSVPCAFCQGGLARPTMVVVARGGTGDFAQQNGTWTLPLFAQCEWFAQFPGPLLEWDLFPLSTTAWHLSWTTFGGNPFRSAGYDAAGTWDCMSARVFVLSQQTGAGTPATITVVPT